MSRTVESVQLHVTTGILHCIMILWLRPVFFLKFLQTPIRVALSEIKLHWFCVCVGTMFIVWISRGARGISTHCVSTVCCPTGDGSLILSTSLWIAITSGCCESTDNHTLPSVICLIATFTHTLLGRGSSAFLARQMRARFYCPPKSGVKYKEK